MNRQKHKWSGFLTWTEKHIKQCFNYLHIGFIQVAIKPYQLGLNASIVVSVRDITHNYFVDSMMRVIQSSHSDGLIYCNCLPNLTIGLHKLEAIKAATINILLQGLNIEEDSYPYALFCRTQYRIWILSQQMLKY